MVLVISYYLYNNNGAIGGKDDCPCQEGGKEGSPAAGKTDLPAQAQRGRQGREHHRQVDAEEG